MKETRLNGFFPNNKPIQSQAMNGISSKVSKAPEAEVVPGTITRPLRGEVKFKNGDQINYRSVLLAENKVVTFECPRCGTTVLFRHLELHPGHRRPVCHHCVGQLNECKNKTK
jgi:predicted RNA-binding Zn-ribbon protein involved in translation (DUF1610 family)